ncbi:GFA family protein [Pseudomonas taiwanensis]|uniref:GFA family protein n=1 Tax=Pseudomonas taiwanensis TaxID=470150 RepID=UPI0015BF6EA7|nr:GFA family protein [Pseudomonas taiwanensis]NWL76003.1 GFA family protein [Pseudomonas taiwanensis]
MHHGSCLCGAVKYEIDAPIESATHCHCSQCRKAHGAAFGTYFTVRWSNFRWVQGEDVVAKFHSSPGVTRTFCQQCGSTLQWYSQNAGPDCVGVALGTLDSALGEIPQSHIYTDSKADWYVIADGLPQESRS